MAELDGPLPREEAVRWLGLALEAVVENYAEYIDYNSTTTQSDRGEMLYTLLDYLRLRTSYDLVAWKLQPVVLAHDVLVRCGCEAAAESWRHAVTDRTADIADEHLKRFARLNRKYGMRLPSIAERLEERFLRPLEVDQLCALVQPAIEELRSAVSAEPNPPPAAKGPAPAARPGGVSPSGRRDRQVYPRNLGGRIRPAVLAGGLAAGSRSGPVAGRRGRGVARSRTARPANPALPGRGSPPGAGDPRRLTAAVVLYWRIV